jgi:hypothetical protein
MILGYAIIAVPTGIVSSELTKNRSSRKQDKIIAKEEVILNKMKDLEDKIDKLSRD